MARDKELHIRRCHVCGTMNEVKGKKVDKCSGCGKSLAPFYFYDEHSLIGFGDLPVDSQKKSLRSSADLKDQPFYSPIKGLTSYW